MPDNKVVPAETRCPYCGRAFALTLSDEPFPSHLGRSSKRCPGSGVREAVARTLILLKAMRGLPRLKP